MSEIPLILRCPRGEWWPVNLFQLGINMREMVQTYETIWFKCPAGHSFSLGTAVKSKTFTPDHARQFIMSAIIQIAQARYGDLPGGEQ